MEQFDKMLKVMAEKEGMIVPNGFDERLQDVLDDLPAKTKKRGLKAVKGVLIAAACLALVGTAFAAAKIFNIRVIWQDKTGVSDSGYTVEYTVEFYPVDSFTQEAAAMAAIPDSHQYFRTWDEMEEFFGLDLVKNPVLDGAIPGPQGTEPWDPDHTEQGTTHILLVPVFTDDGALKIVQGIGSYQLDGVWVRLGEFIYTERAEGNLLYGNGAHPWHGVVYPNGSELSEEVYTTANGLTATIVKTSRSAPNESVTCSAYFLIDGAAFYVAVGGSGPNGELPTPDADHAMEVLKMVLDGFTM